MTTGKVIGVGKKLEKVLEKMEAIPVRFGQNAKELQQQKQDFETTLSYSHKVLKLLGTRHGCDRLHRIQHAIERNMIALKYRIEKINGGDDKADLDIDLYEKMLLLTGKWKIKQKFYSNEDKKLSQRDAEKVEKLCLYPEFCKLLENDTHLQNHFFAWSIRDNNGVDQFIQFPTTSDKINKNYLAERIGRFAEEHFKISKCAPDDSSPSLKEKIVTLPFDTTSGIKHLNILDEHVQVELKGNWKLTIHQIFKLFSRKHAEVTELEFFGPTGITNWNSYELGYWDPATKTYVRPDYSEKDWIRKLPTIEELTSEEIEARYGEKPEPGLGKIFVVSKRNHADLDVVKRHSYLEIAIPVENGKFSVISLGIYPVRFPVTILENLKFLAATVLSKIVYPDLNIYLPKRQYAIHPLKLTKEQFDQLVENVGKDILAGLNGNLTFKFIDENCSYWTQKKVNEIVEEEDPNYFEMPLHMSNSKGVALQVLFGFLNSLPPVIRGPIIRAILKVLGGEKGVYIEKDGQKVYESVLGTNKPYNNITIFQPGLLYKAINEGKRPGRISFGH